MENPEPDRTPASEEGGSLNRNRSFKSKQLVRSQAIREMHSPPRVATPADDAGAAAGAPVAGPATGGEEERETEKRRPIEIQITSGSWDNTEQRARRRWPPQRDLLSHAPRVACVAGPGRDQRCRGQRRRHQCPTKQDSGISCPDDCTDCSEFDQAGCASSDVRKACSLDSDDSYCRCPDRRDKPKNTLSRTESDVEKLEPTGPELIHFIKETLNKNPRDRMTLLKIEKELHALVTDNGRCIVKFPVMTSYGRMLVHRVATLFQLNHHLDHSTKNCVTVSKTGTSGGRIPCTSFKQWCTANFPPSPVRQQDSINAKSILKRDTHSPDAMGEACRAVERSKSLEQREREYERVRRRIFSSDNCSQDESQWPWLNTGHVKLLTPDSSRNKLLKVQSLESSGPPASWRNRGAVSKSHSFGGYGPEPPRLLSRQGDLASSSWRLSPSSSGYKTLSLRSSPSVTPPPTGTSPEPASEGALVWAVTDLSSVPPGALVIHPQTGRPLTNPDGSVYHFDPSNPPVIYDASAYIQDPKGPNCDKRRGRLEKQHSFIDTEAECRCEDGRSKCCSECRRHDSSSHGTSTEKLSTQTEQKSHQTPLSPVKNRYEQNAEPPANQNAATETSTNHNPPYEQPPNQNSTSEPIKQQIEVPPNQVQSFESTNQIPVFESKNEAGNQAQYEQTFENGTFVASPHQRPPSFEPTNHRPPSFDAMANQRPPSECAANQGPPMGKLISQTSVDAPQFVPQQNYGKVFRNDEVTSPPQMVHNHAIQPDVNMYNMMAQAKITPIPVQDPNIRPISLSNMVFPAPMAPGYPYVSQIRMEQPLQPVYQPVMQEDQKLPPSPHANDTTFRIDPSYPYAPLQYGAACGACAGASLETPGQPRGYNLNYGQLEQPMLQQPYPVGNLLLQHNVQHYPYQEAMQWGSPVPMAGAPAKILMHDLCAVYPQYPYIYPQMIPQPYPIVQPIYPGGDKRPTRGPLPNSHRATPHDTHERDSEIALKIQQIKEQMANLNTQDKEKSGNGLLGNPPVGGFNGRVGGRVVNDETQLTSAARAIVNSIRNMQANSYQHETRRQHSDAHAHGERRRRDPRLDKPRPHYGAADFTQVSPGDWCRRSPGPMHPVLNHPRRPHPDTRNGRR